MAYYIIFIILIYCGESFGSNRGNRRSSESAIRNPKDFERIPDPLPPPRKLWFFDRGNLRSSESAIRNPKDFERIPDPLPPPRKLWFFDRGNLRSSESAIRNPKDFERIPDPSQKALVLIGGTQVLRNPSDFEQHFGIQRSWIPYHFLSDNFYRQISQN